MLQFITGRSGSGKTAEVFRELKQRAAEEGALFLLVPEQASYENERRLLTELGPVLSQRVQVLSFTRMADTVFREVGGVGGKRMDATLSMLLMSQALHGVSGSLTVYRKHVDSPEYLQALAAMLTELKQCAITPDQLTALADTLPDSLLKRKLTDLGSIFGAYDALVTQASLVDPQDDLTWLAKKLPDSRIFDGARVYVDGFKGFTRQELIILERLMPHVQTLTVTLCADDILPRVGGEFDRFATAIRTAQQLRDAADRAHIRKPLERRMETNHRTADPSLLALEEGCFTTKAIVCEDATDAVTVTACADRIEECRYAARLIRRLLREEGGYCRDFTVVSRDPDGYNDILETALRREGLPCCRDYREPVMTQPLIVLVESALSAVTHGWDSTDVLRIVKTGLAGFSATSASMLENYAFVWSVRGKQWRAPFTEHPDGLTARADEKSDSRLAYLNVLRRRLVRPLERFDERLSGYCTGRQFAEAVYALLCEWHVARSVRLRVAQLDAANEHALADHQARLWEYLMDLLDKFAVGLADTRLSAERFAELFRLAVANDDLGSIPQGLDGVTVGSVDHIRYAQPHTVIVLGANEGVLPAYPSTGGILTDYERLQLIKAGLPMADSADRQTAEERFYAYSAVAAPSKRLVVTYHRRNGKEEAYPSSLITEIERLVPHHIKGDAHAIGSESEEDAFAAFAACYRENSADAAAYRAVFESIPTYRGRLEAMRRLEDGFAFRSADKARETFGDVMRLSPSQAENFYTCRFSYFCRYGLRLKPRRSAQVNPADVGTLAHYLLETLLPAYCREDIKRITREQITADTAKAVHDYVDTVMGGKDTRDAQFEVLVKRLTRQCDFYVWRVVRELQQSRFEPVDYELPIGWYDENENGLPAWELVPEDGKKIRIIGKIDRVDILRKDDRTYLRIADYKTGVKTFDIANMLAGVDMQLLIYLFALCENGTERYGNHLLPSGVFYVPARIPEIKIPADSPAAFIEKEQLRTMCSSGLLLNDPEVLEAMEAEMEGVFIPLLFDKKGELKTDNLATLSQFGAIRKRLESLLTDMMQVLHRGDVAACPKKGQYLPCDYCDFHDICGRESEDPMEEIAAVSLQEALADLEEVDEDE